jgi:IS5 family transposase
LLIAFYSVRSDRQFCEQLDYNLLFRWFLDLDLESGGLDQSNFSRLRERLVETDIARRFFDEVVRLARKDKLLSSDHFTVDGTLIDAWASFKSFKRKDDDEPPKSGGDGTGMVDFKGEKRSNATHRSTTDPDAKLMRKGNGQPAKLSYGGHALMENRSGLCIDLLITDATMAEHKAARQLLTRARRRRIHPKTLGADKGYHVKDFVRHLREHKIKPHIARIDGRKTPGLDGRTTCTEGYKVSQRKRKRVEEIFGWLKTVGGMRKTRFIGEARTQIAAYLSAAAYNLLRIAKLQDAGRAA